MKIKSIFAMLLIAMLIFAGCSGDNPQPNQNNDTNTGTISKESMIQTTSSGKFVVEKTMQGLLSDDALMQKINANLGQEISLSGNTYNGVTIEEGTVKVTQNAARAISDGYNLEINITKAQEDQGSPISIFHESAVDIVNNTITNPRPIKTEAKLDGNIVADIDDTFVPVSMIFNSELLKELSLSMEKFASDMISNLVKNTSIKEFTSELGNMKITISTEKSALISDGTGILVFKLTDIENQWHTVKSFNGTITIDGWADVNKDEGKLSVSDNPIIDDGSLSDSDKEEIIALTPDIWGFLTCALGYIDKLGLGEGIQGTVSGAGTFSYNATPDTLADFSEISKPFFDGKTVGSLSIVQVYGEPNINGYQETLTTMQLKLSGMDEISFQFYEANSQAEVKELKIGDKSYLSFSMDIMKSMLRTAMPLMYIMNGSDMIMNPEHTEGKLTWDEATSSYMFKSASNGSGSFTGEVKLDIKNAPDAELRFGDFSFDKMNIKDYSGEYIMSGKGSYETKSITVGSYTSRGLSDLSIDAFEVIGLGATTKDELSAIANVIKFIQQMYYVLN